MSTPRHNPIPPEIEALIQQKPVEEQERLRQVWQLLGHLDIKDFEDTAVEDKLLNDISTNAEENTPQALEHLDIPDTETALQDLVETIEQAGSDHSTVAQPGLPAGDRLAKPQVRHIRTRSPKHNSMQWTTAIATLSLVLFAAMIWYWRAPVVVKAPLGEQVTVVLPDNSTITLNSGSRMEYARRFESWPLIATSKRRVFLQGEAFFNVEHMEKPFLVESFNAQIRVLGTSFNVWSREHDSTPETRVTLSSGRVQVTPHGVTSEDQEDQTTTLDQLGHTVRVVPLEEGMTGSLKDSVSVEQVTVWRTKGFSVFGMSVASVVSEIERRYALAIQLDPEIDDSKILTLFFQDEPSPEIILEAMCLAIGCQYRQSSDGYSIFPVQIN